MIKTSPHNSYLLNMSGWSIRETICTTLQIKWEDRFEIFDYVTEEGVLVLKDGRKYKLILKEVI